MGYQESWVYIEPQRKFEKLFFHFAHSSPFFRFCLSFRPCNGRLRSEAVSA